MAGPFRFLVWLVLLISFTAAAQCRPPVYRAEHILAVKEKAVDERRYVERASDGRQSGAQADSRPTLSQRDYQEQAFRELTRDQLKALLAVRSRLARVAPLFPPIGICADAMPNAFSLPAGQISKDGAIIFTTGMLQLLGSDSNNLAAVLAHEYAHIVEEHSKQKAAFRRQADDIGLRVGTTVAMVTGNLAVGILVAKTESLKQQAAFSRAVELRADDAGYGMYIEAGFDPRNASGALRLLLAANRQAPVNYLDTHSALDERIVRLDGLARDDTERIERTENAKAQATSNAPFLTSALELWKAKKNRELSAFVDDWLVKIPTSSPAWYYRGLLMREAADLRSKAWEAFERAVNFDPSSAEAWEALCDSLNESGYRSEAAVCVAAMHQVGHATAELEERLFEGRIWVHGRPNTSEAQLWWPRQADGRRLITNDKALLNSKGLPLEPIPPTWMPTSR